MNKTVTSCFGYQQITSLSSAQSLTVPDKNPQGSAGTPTVAIIRCETQAVRWRDDGTAPTASVGMPLAVGDTLVYDGDLKKIQFIEQTASAKLNVSLYS
jgi:hypothetical protein